MQSSTHIDELVELAKNGCTRSISKLWNRTKPMALSIAKRYSIDGTDADILANDALTKAIMNISNWKGSGKFESWVSVIVRNESINAVKIGKKSRNEVSIELCTSGETQVISDDYEMDLILSLVNSLPPGQRQIFSMIAIDGIKQADICKQLGMTPIAVRSAYSKARKKLMVMCKSENLR